MITPDDAARLGAHPESPVMADAVAAEGASRGRHHNTTPEHRAAALGRCCDDSPHICPGCQRVMSHREAAEQAACNDCHGQPMGPP